MARILLIEDDDSLRKMLGEVLKSAGHTVLFAGDGKQGMKVFNATPADLVITDLFMPNQEGLETIMALRASVPNIPIIAMSGRSPARTMLSIAERLGATETLEKSFSAEQLLAAVERALKSGNNESRKA